MIFDENFRQHINNQVSSNIDEAQKDVEYAKALSNLKLQKLQRYFLESLSDLSFGVTKLSTNTPVFSFKLRKLSGYIQNALEELNRTIEKDSQLPEEIVTSRDNVDSERAVKTKELIATLKKLKSKQQENKNVDYYQFMKADIK